MWELQALVEFMYRGEVYVEQQQLATLMQAAEVLQVFYSSASIAYVYMYNKSNIFSASYFFSILDIDFFYS